MMNDLELAKHILTRDSLAFVLVKDGSVLQTGTDPGVRELIIAIRSLNESAFGASLADKIVGKAVAMVARYARLSAVYSPLASEAARQALARAKISFEYDQLVPLILNKRNDGPCPMERLTMPIDDPREAVVALAEFVKLPISIT